MKIFFSPEYSGHVFVRPSEDGRVMMDTLVANTLGMVNLLELRMGVHHEEVPREKRVALYYDAVCRYMAEHLDNVMAASFATSGLGTAKAMLGWRDGLSLAGWDFEGTDGAGRLAVLAGVEEYFGACKGCDMAQRLREVTELVAARRLDCKDLAIEMAVGKELLRPAERALVEALEAQGARVATSASAPDKVDNLSRVREMIASKGKEKIRLDKEDKSLQIWKFADERLACEYLAYKDIEDVDVWVNGDNKQMDNWLSLMGKPLTGSVAADCTPQLTQLFVMGLGLFAEPLNVGSLIEWLNMPVHPMGSFFRARLADCIVKEGGYRNEACKDMIKRFVEGEFVYLSDEEKALPVKEQKKIRKKEMKSRERQALLFLPPMERREALRTEEVRQFVEGLSSWARQRVLLMAAEADSKQWTEQLMAVAGMCDAFLILLGTEKAEVIDYKTVDSWMSTIYEKGDFVNAVAERGCRTVVDSPAKMASLSSKTVWMGVDGDASHGQECAFLYPSERERLASHLTPWDEEAENHYHEQMMLTPLRMTTGQLILVVRERMGGEATLKHPLIVRLEQQVENIEDIVYRPFIGADERQETEKMGAREVEAELHFDHADKLRWPDNLSPTTIGTLVEHPLDFMMERLLGITSYGKAAMADVKTTKGNVAHAVIEALFAPRGRNTQSTPEEIEKRIAEEFDEVYANVVEAQGAILQLAENRLAEKLLKEQLRKCLDVLLGILKENRLKVTGCERKVECRLDLGLPESDSQNQRDMLGFIDMTLEDGEGHPVVFDFKWTSSARWYQELLKENRSVQLEMYRTMLGKEKGDDVKRVAYFLMPESCLYSTDRFNGSHCVQLNPDNNDNIVEQLKQSVKYRMEQMNGGVVETNGVYEELQYVKDTAGRGLFALKRDDKTGMKKDNRFTQYQLFNK